ncbi:hypothetical protein E2C01_068182 [Portunus trituberculatus]|uniref:Uncharacterized protein n=1 Tax=Portunus trituberculatus TaxID=210409 RepID=A0A5B7HR90_PORTR|nr:hypothetical protein [Portunus trituberculatus]
MNFSPPFPSLLPCLASLISGGNCSVVGDVAQRDFNAALIIIREILEADPNHPLSQVMGQHRPLAFSPLHLLPFTPSPLHLQGSLTPLSLFFSPRPFTAFILGFLLLSPPSLVPFSSPPSEPWTKTEDNKGPPPPPPPPPPRSTTHTSGLMGASCLGLTHAINILSIRKRPSHLSL